LTATRNVTREGFLTALSGFSQEAERADWVVVYYAGHGLEIDGTNYLVPVDVTFANDRAVALESVSLSQVLIAIESAKKLRLVLLDACRDNPFVTQIRRSDTTPVPLPTSSGRNGSSTRTIGRGKSVCAKRDLSLYAAKHGQYALDGEGKNSPFVAALTQRITMPGIEVTKLFRLVRDDVLEVTAGRQEPYIYGSVPGREDFFFVNNVAAEKAAQQ
jgi:uncharacterized caspase-like protein